MLTRVWSAESLDQILLRAEQATRESSTPSSSGERIVSMVFAPPDRELWKNIDYPYVNGLAGSSWDLFFVGAPGVAKGDASAPREGVALWSAPEHIDWGRFGEIARDVNLRHSTALSESHEFGDRTPWKFGGEPEIVSFLTRSGRPDWLTLTSVGVEANSVNAIAARFVPGADGLSDPDLSPGNPVEYAVGGPALASALKDSALKVSTYAASGVIGTGAWVALTSLFK